MVIFTLTVVIDQSHMDQFAENGFKLCLANGVNSFNKLNFNVIALSEPVFATNNVIQFSDQYNIAATETSTEPGVKITITTKVQPISFGESYTLPADWANGTVAPDNNAPEDGFLFINQAPSAACVLLRTFGFNLPPTPIYTTVAGQIPPGTEGIIPTNQISVWFQVGDDLPGSRVTDDFKTTSVVVDFTGHTSYTVTYNAEGAWIISNADLESDVAPVDKCVE